MAIWKNKKLINIRHLYYFLASCECSSLALASHKVYISQPAITQGIQKIEERVGTSLFTRKKSGVYLTNAGEVFKVRVIRAFEHLHKSFSGVASLSSKLNNSQMHISQILTTAQLRALIAIVSHGSFVRAAKEIKISTSTLHHSARELENIMQSSLFEKTSYGIRPTRLGDVVAQGVSKFFHEIEQGIIEINALLGDERGVTVIGAMPLARSFLVPQAVNKFCSDSVSHRVSILEGTYESLIKQLKNCEIDFLVGALRDDFEDDDLKQEHLFDDPLSIIMRPGHPLENSKSFTKEDLESYQWITPRNDTPLYNHLLKLIDISKTSQNIVECNTLDSARVILNSSDRLMLSSDSQTQFEQSSGMLVSRPHPAGDVLRAIGMTSRKDWQPTKTQQTLLRYIRNLSADLK